MQRLIPMLLATGVAVIALAACGSSSAKSSPATTTPPTTVATSAPASNAAMITIKNAGASFVFETTPVKPGATVTVRNTTDSQHTVTANTSDGGFDITVDPGKTATFTGPMKAGSYGFHCNIHTNMQANLTVT